ncbi:MAG: hypothetical protein LBG84_10465 [Treponema sp.]|jgi:hypothetical protein|nr:hypothetical protein [Treponema sp.]
MAHGDWFPTRELEQIDMMRKWKAGLANAAYRTQFKWDDEDCTVLIAAIDAALDAHAAYEADKTPEKRLAKDHALGQASAAIRDFANAHIRYNKRMPPEKRLEFGIRERDGEPSGGGEPATRANITDLKPLGGAAVEIRFQDEDTPHSWAIPAAYNGCLLAYAAGPEKVDDYALLTTTELMTHHIWRLELPPSAVGQWLSLAVRWQSHTGIKGRWSEILHIAVS